MTTLFQTIDQKDLRNYGESVHEFLHWLGRPTMIRVPGVDSSRKRVVTTLLHGNEPSGLVATYLWLKQGKVPSVDTWLVIANTEAAMVDPELSHRHLAGKRDLNRCFYPPWDVDEQGEIAREILDLIERENPEAILDIHNTSGSGPAFAVASSDRPENVAIGSLIARRMIVTDLRLGALIELGRDVVPAVVLEAGGSIDPEANHAAEDALKAFLHTDQLWPQQDSEFLDVLHEPIRIELANDTKLVYGDDSPFDVRLPESAVQLNFGVQPAGKVIAELSERGMAVISARGPTGEVDVEQFFREENGQMVCQQDLHVFMLTPNAQIALDDCLCYVCPDPK